MVLSWEVVITLISLIGTLVGIASGFIGYKKGLVKDAQEISKQSSTIEADIGYIKDDIAEIKHTQEEWGQKFYEVIKDIAVLEASVKSAHKRLDSFQYRFKGGEE